MGTQMIRGLPETWALHSAYSNEEKKYAGQKNTYTSFPLKEQKEVARPRSD